MKQKRELLQNLPGVDILLEEESIKTLLKIHNLEIVKFAIRETLASIRRKAESLKAVPGVGLISQMVSERMFRLTGNSFRKVYNATGVIVHTNLGRAPFSKQLLEDATKNLYGYSNLEFNLETGKRGSRHDHLEYKLRYLTGAEDVLVVNNNAAAVILLLRTFAKNKEVIVSRGELIEIGGSFRIPEIMAASDCIMKEVGATNKTHLRDYENIISEKTAMLFKAHQSNYSIEGFTKEVSLEELVRLGKKYRLPVYYDMGSGLLRRTNSPVLDNEPDVRQTLKAGVDLVSFSGDKLIGGPQAGIIAGKKELIRILKKEPMVRALRVGKTTIAFMQAALQYYLDDKKLNKHNTIFESLNQSEKELENRASKFSEMLNSAGICNQIAENKGYCGGGALPTEEIQGKAVKLILERSNVSRQKSQSEKLHFNLLKQETPVVAILRKGDIYFEMLSLRDEDIEPLTGIIKNALKEIS